MNKRAFLGLGTTVIVVVLLVFAGIVIAMFFFGEGLLPKIAEITKGFERFLPGKAEKDIPPGLKAPEDIIEIFDGLYNAFSNSRGKEDCFIEYKSLDVRGYQIELEYIEEEKGVNMRLLSPKGRSISDHFVSDVKPCIVLPDKNDNIAGVRALDKADIKDDNKLYYGGKGYSLFGEYPLLYKPKNNNWVCFFTDDKVIDPIDGKVYGATILNDGFDNGDMRRFGKEIPKCV